MKKYIKYCGLSYFFLDTIIQICFFSNLSLDLVFKTIQEYGFFNTFVLWMFAEAIFGEDNFIHNWLFVIFILCIVSLIALLIALFFNKKIVFIILLFYCVLNVIFHIIILSDKQYTYVGLIYKIVGCITYIFMTARDWPKPLKK